MRIGELNRRIDIRHYTWTEDEWGEPKEDWASFAKVWAKIEPLSGREYWDAMKVNSEATHNVTIRYLPTLKAEMRIKFNDCNQIRTFEILHFHHDEAKRRTTSVQVKEVLE